MADDALVTAAPPAPPAGAAPPLATLEGSVERITFQNEESGFTVVRLQPAGKSHLVTVVGKLAAVHVGEHLRLRGRWTSHPQHGRQFEVHDYRVVLPTSVEGIRKYLGSGLVRGIGPVMADRLVRHFGARTLAVIEEEPERLTEAPGIGPVRARAIQAAWQEQKAIKELMLFLAEHGVSTTLGVGIYRQYGDDAVRVVREAPYRLAREVRGIGFRTADQIARRLGFAPDAPERAMAALSHVLWEATEEGHVYLPADELLQRAEALLGLPAATLQQALDALAAEGEVEIEPRVAPPGGAPAVYLRPLARAEQGLAGRLRGLLHAPTDRLALWQQVDFARAFAWLRERSGVELAPAQAEAVRAALTQRVVVLTGGPGTGKTTTVRALLTLLQAKRGTYLLASPTGKAAKRLSEATGAPAKTLHRLLGLGFDGQAAHDADRPLDADLVVVDEASMLDLLLANQLVRAVPRGAHLLLVGDADQLPSVGAGNVLADLIASQQVPVVRLEVIFRQAAQSGIVVNAHRILRGEPPDLHGFPDFRFLAADEPDEALARLRTLLTETLPRQYGLDPRRDIQVLTPMRVGRLGSDTLNQVLQATLNPPAPGKAERAFGGRVFRVGDRVLCVRNDYRRETFNGDGGLLQRLDPVAQTLEVALDDGRVVPYDFADLDTLQHAYALSVHRAQGSEYEAVVLLLHPQHYLLLQRNLLYTAVTRARRLVILLGSRRALAIALRNTRRAERYSGLAARLRGLPREAAPCSTS